MGDKRRRLRTWWGMSQNGAKGMAAQGKNWEEILQYFYKDIEIGNLNQVVMSRFDIIGEIV